MAQGFKPPKKSGVPLGKPKSKGGSSGSSGPKVGRKVIPAKKVQAIKKAQTTKVSGSGSHSFLFCSCH